MRIESLWEGVPLVKNAILIFVCSLLSFNLSFASGAEANPRLVQVYASDVIIPMEFTSTSEVYVIASGVFPNGCYRWSHADVTHKDRMTHEIKIMAVVVEGPCKMVLVPFLEPIPLGRFDVGHHSLKFLNHDGTHTEKILQIESF